MGGEVNKMIKKALSERLERGVFRGREALLWNYF